MHMWPCLCPWNERMSVDGPWERSPQSSMRADGALQGLCCRAGLRVPGLCLVLVPGTVGLLDGKFLAGQAPRQQFE